MFCAASVVVDETSSLYVSSYYCYIRVLILLCRSVIVLLYMCPHTTAICVLILLLYMCPHTTAICVLILLSKWCCVADRNVFEEASSLFFPPQISWHYICMYMCIHTHTHTHTLIHANLVHTSAKYVS